PFGSSGAASKAAKRLPSAASSSRSSCETAAPAIRGTGGTESSSKHIGSAAGRRERLPRDGEGAAVATQCARNRIRAGLRGVNRVVRVAVQLDRRRRPDRVGDAALVSLDSRGRVRKRDGAEVRQRQRRA